VKIKVCGITITQKKTRGDEKDFSPDKKIFAGQFRLFSLSGFLYNEPKILEFLPVKEYVPDKIVV